MSSNRALAVVAKTVVALLIAYPAFAQGANVSEGVGFGVEAGLTRTTVTGSDVQGTQAQNGLMGGIWFGGNRGGRVGFMGELTYLVKEVGESGGGSTLKLHYLEIPAVLRVNIGSRAKNGASVYVLAGPVVDILLKGDLDGVDVKSQFNGYDAGVLGGLGFEVVRIGVEGRGNWGLKSLVNNSGEFGTSDAKSFTFQIVAKIRIN
jgi:outer membrane protein with beta-barrel domain